MLFRYYASYARRYVDDAPVSAADDEIVVTADVKMFAIDVDTRARDVYVARYEDAMICEQCCFMALR